MRRLCRLGAVALVLTISVLWVMDVPGHTSAWPASGPGDGTEKLAPEVRGVLISLEPGKQIS